MGIRNKAGYQAAGAVQIRIDGIEGDVIGYVSMEDIPKGKEFTERTAQLTGSVEGVHDLYFIFAGENYEIETWQFMN